MSDLERRLLETDFSAESRVRQSLRRRLLVGRGPVRPRLAFAFAAAFALCLAPFHGKIRGLIVGADHPPQLIGIGFASIPGSPFVTAAVTTVNQDGRRAVVWELDGRRIALESRPVTNADIFEVPAF